MITKKKRITSIFIIENNNITLKTYTQYTNSSPATENKQSKVGKDTFSNYPISSHVGACH